MFPGGLTGQAPGATRDMIRSMRASYFGGAMKLEITPDDEYRGRFFALFANGIWQGNFPAPLVGDIVTTLPFPAGGTVGSIWAEDAGDWETFENPQDIPDGMALDEEADTARRLLFSWLDAYELTPPRGSNLVNVLTIAGARRGINVATVPEFPTRGRLTFSLVDAGDDSYVVRFWNDARLVAQSAPTAPGPVICQPVNNSNLTIACTFTAGLLAPGPAFVDIRWPAAYQIHYSTTPLIFPRAPQDVVFDNGADSYSFLTPELSAGAYHYAILQVDDDGIAQAAAIEPADSPLQINLAPLPPSNIRMDGTATALTVRWQFGEGNCTFKVYSSQVNGPLNFGDTLDGPAPVAAGLNATAARLAPITGIAPTDHTADYDALVTAIDAATAAITAACTAGESGFDTACATLSTDLQTAISAYGNALTMDLGSYQTRAAQSVTALRESAHATQGVDPAVWASIVSWCLGQLLWQLGLLIDGNGGRYALPDGSHPAADGTGGTGGLTLYDVGQPLLRPACVRIVVRATKDGIEEHADLETTAQFDAAGRLVLPPPNVAALQSIAVTNGLQVAALIGVIEDNAPRPACAVDLYIVPEGMTIDPATPQASAQLPVISSRNYHEIAARYTAPAPGWYQLATAARTAAGHRSILSPIYNLYLDTSAPGGVTAVQGTVVRNQAARSY